MPVRMIDSGDYYLIGGASEAVALPFFGWSFVGHTYTNASAPAWAAFLFRGDRTSGTEWQFGRYNGVTDYWACYDGAATSDTTVWSIGYWYRHIIICEPSGQWHWYITDPNPTVGTIYLQHLCAASANLECIAYGNSAQYSGQRFVGDIAGFKLWYGVQPLKKLQDELNFYMPIDRHDPNIYDVSPMRWVDEFANYPHFWKDTVSRSEVGTVDASALPNVPGVSDIYLPRFLIQMPGISAGSSIKTLTASVTGQSTVTASFKVQIHVLTASVSGQSTVTGSFTTIRPLTASISGQSTVTASFTTIRPFTASISGQSTVTANLQKVGAVKSLTADIAGQSTVTALFTAIRPFAAAIQGQATVTASFQKVAPGIKTMSASVQGQSTVTALLSAIRPFTAAINGQSTVTANFSKAIHLLAANPSGQSTVTASFGKVGVFVGGVTEVFSVPGGGSDFDIPGGGSTFSIPN